MILVTGSTGLVGSHLIYDLLLKGYKVKALVRKSSNKNKILHTFKLYTPDAEALFSQITWCEGDVTDIISLDYALTDVDKVYHTAALVSFNPKDKKKIYSINVEGTANVVNLCMERNISKLCFVSSIASLGITEDGSPISEDTAWKPSKNMSAYSISKFKSEMEVWRGITEGLNAVIVNPSVILGPGSWETGSASVFSLIDKGLAYFTLGTTGFVDVKDVAKTMILLMDSEISSERFILSSENMTYKAFFEMIANYLEVRPPHKELTPLMAGLAWRLEAIRSRLSFSNPKITKNTIDIGFKKLNYSSEKAKNLLNIDFLPIEPVLNELSSIYKTHNSSSGKHRKME